LFTFDGTITFNNSGTYQVQRDFGDGSLGQMQTFGPGPNTFQLQSEPHLFNPGAYTSVMNIISPTGCTGCGSQAPVNFTAFCPGPTGGGIPIPLCQSCNFVTQLCKALEPLFLLAYAIGVALLVATGSACPPNPYLTGSFLGLAVAFGLVLYFLCRKCICDFFTKLSGQAFFILGCVLLIFVIPPNCGQPFPFLNWVVALLSAGYMLVFGFLILWLGWYLPNKANCTLSICDFWCLIGGLSNNNACTKLAMAAAIIVWFLLGGLATMGWSGLGLSLSVAVLISNYACTRLYAHNCSCNQC